jgi:hypothetical protein
LVLKDIDANAFTDVTFLSTNQKLVCKKEGKDMVISLPEYDPNKIKSPYAYVIRINNFGAYVRKPQIDVTYLDDMSGATISLRNDDPQSKLIYTIGTGKPQTYAAPFVLKGDATVKAFAIKNNGSLPSDTSTASTVGLSLMKAMNTGNLQSGLTYQYYESDEMSMDVFKKSSSLKKGVAEKVNVSQKQRKEKYGLQFEGFINIDKTAGYSFYTTSDDGSILEIDGKLIVNNDGNHGFEEKEGKAFLEKGYHTIKIRYFDSGGGNNLLFSYNQLGQAKKEVPASILFH